MDIVKLSGLAIGGTCKAMGLPFSTEFSMFVEEAAKAVNEIKNTVDRVETIVTAQVFGNAVAAKKALLNSKSSDLSDEARVQEVVRAWHLFEKCYGDLSGIPFLMKHRGEISFLTAMCHRILGNRELEEQNLREAYADLIEFGKIKPEPMKTGQAAGNIAGLWFSASTTRIGALATIIGGLGLVAGTGGLGLFVIGAGMTAGGYAVGKRSYDTVNNYQSAKKLLEESQQKAAIEARDIQKTLEAMS